MNNGDFVWSGTSAGGTCTTLSTSGGPGGQFIALAPGGFEFLPSTSTTTPVFSIAPATGNVTATGSATAASFVGDGSALMGITVSGTLPNAAFSGTYSNALTFSNASNSFTGNGAGLTALKASNLSSGPVPGAALSGTYSNALTFSNASNSFTGNGAGLTGVSTSVLAAGTYANALVFSNPSNSFTGSFSGNGSLVTNLDAAHLFDGIAVQPSVTEPLSGLTGANVMAGYMGTRAGTASRGA